VVHDLQNEAIERAYREHAILIWRGIYAFSGGRRDIADDAVAEAFARALASSDRIESPVPWLYRVAFRAASKALTQERRMPQAPPEPDAAGTGDDRTIGVIGALEMLPPNQRAIVFLHYYADMSIADIARARRTTPVNVRVQLHRARQALRRKYESAATMTEACATDQGGDNFGRVA
jgi:RNA polymerase sigma-70 factor, ECF subfamily